MTGRRLAALWLADWPIQAAVIAGLLAGHEVAALADRRRLVSVSAAGRACGLRRGHRLRSAQEQCPDLVLLPADQTRDARAFEQVAALAEDLVPGVELVRPGLLLMPATGASRYYGSDAALAEHILSELAGRLGLDGQVGIADGLLAAILAARHSQIIEPGQSRSYLAGQPITALRLALAGTTQAPDITALENLLIRLGIGSLGALADLPSRDVTARFGSIGIWARRLARAQDVALTLAHRPEPEFRVSLSPDPPIELVSAAAFAARRLAEDLHAQLLAHGRGYSRLEVVAWTQAGEELCRTWRVEGIDAAAVADRVRWQLEAWLTQRAEGADGALTELALSAQEVQPAGLTGQRLWGQASDDQTRAARAAERVQTLFSTADDVSYPGSSRPAVWLPVEQGGRDPRTRIRLVPWGDEAIPLRPVERPWPSCLPDPAPSTVPRHPIPVDLLDQRRRPVAVAANLQLSAPPSWLVREQVEPVIGWAGPWPVIERWWAPDGRRRVFLQTLTKTSALLLACENSAWSVEGIYD